MSRILSVLILFLTNSLFSQNLIPNPSFENITNEPFYGCEFQYMQDWINPAHGVCGNYNNGTPDIFSYTSTGGSRLPNSFMGSLAPRTGNRLVGFGTYVSDIANYREYITAKLTSSLIVGQKYLVKLWIRNSNPPTYIYHSNSVQVAFTLDSLNQVNDDLVPNITPQLSIDSVIRDTTWKLFHFLYTPNQSFRYMTIGNFRTDANTIKEQFGINNGTNRPYAYYFFDDISVSPYIPLLNVSDTAACTGQVVSISAANSISGQYHWFLSGTSTYIDNDSILTVPVNSATTYIVTDGYYNDTVVINSLTAAAPTLLGPDTSFCSSEPYIINATQPNSTYQWNNGATTPFILANSAGMYSVTVTGASGCHVSDSIYLAIAPPLTASFSITQPSCGLSNGVLTCLNINGFAPINVQWNLGGNNISNTYQSTNLGSGTYYFNAIDALGCTIDTSFTLVNTTGTGSVSLLVSDDTICGGAYANLCAPAGYTSYQWSNGDTTRCVDARIAGNYYVTVIDAGNCTATSTGQSIFAYPLPAVSVTVNGDTLTAFNGVYYQWYFNGEIIEGATSNQYVATQNGTYTVALTDRNGCVASSNGIPFIKTGVDVLIDSELKVYPNPSLSGEWMIETDAVMAGGSIFVFDISGSLVYQSALSKNAAIVSFDGPKGVYTLQLLSGTKAIVKKLIRL